MRVVSSRTGWIARLPALLVGLTFHPVGHCDQVLIDRGTTCQSVADCLAVVDERASHFADGHVEKLGSVVTNLKRFGLPMRSSLLARATGDDRGERRLADLLLSGWGEWTANDVPVLARALSLEHQGMIAHPLAQIGTPEALRALSGDLSHGCGGQSDFMLSKLGAVAIPYLFPLFESQEAAICAAAVIRNMSHDDLVAVAGDYSKAWAKLAADTEQSTAVRLAALRALAALGPAAITATEPIHALVRSSDRQLRAAAIAALLAAEDSEVVAAIAATCRPGASELDLWPFRYTECLRSIRRFHSQAVTAGPRVLAFLRSMNSDERLESALALGDIGYTAAGESLREALHDEDWRVAYAAARGLGMLGFEGARADLQQLAQTHWLPEVREEARLSVTMLTTREAPVADKVMSESSRNAGQATLQDSDDLAARFLGPDPVCPASLWAWHSMTFSYPGGRGRRTDISVERTSKAPPGRLVAEDNGEFGGKLTWRPERNTPSTVYEGEYGVSDLEPTPVGAVAAFGLRHFFIDVGSIVTVTRNAAGRWVVHELARLPGRSDGLARIGPMLYAAWSRGRVVVFDTAGVQGLAECVDSPVESCDSDEAGSRCAAGPSGSPAKLVAGHP